MLNRISAAPAKTVLRDICDLAAAALDATLDVVEATRNTPVSAAAVDACRAAMAAKWAADDAYARYLAKEAA